MQLKCPQCGNTDMEQMRYLEDIVVHRSINGVFQGVLMINGFYETGEGYDEGSNPRIECRAIVSGCSCLVEFPIPDEMEVDFE